MANLFEMESKNIGSKLKSIPKRYRAEQTGSAPSGQNYAEISNNIILEDHDPAPLAGIAEQSERARFLGLLRARCWNAAIRHQLCSNLESANRRGEQLKCVPTGSASARSTICKNGRRRCVARCPKLRNCMKPEAQSASDCKRITVHVCTRLPGCNCARCREEEDNPVAPANDLPLPPQVDVPELNTGTARGVKLLPFPEVQNPDWEPGGVPAPKLGPARAPSVDIVPPLLPRERDPPSNGNLVEDPSVIIERPKSPMVPAPERKPQPAPESWIPPEKLVTSAPPLLPVKRVYNDPKPQPQRPPIGQPEMPPAAPHRRHAPPSRELPRPEAPAVKQEPATAQSGNPESPLVPIHIRPPRAHTPRPTLKSGRGLPPELSCDLRNGNTCGACTSEGTDNPACDPLMVAQFLKAKAGNAAAVELLTAVVQSSSRGRLLRNPMHDPRTQQQYNHQQTIRHQRFNIMRNILGLLLKSHIKSAGRAS